MSKGTEPEIVLNEFGELSRKSRRELLARGIDPETAVTDYIRTHSSPDAVEVEAPHFADEPDVEADAKTEADAVEADVVEAETSELAADEPSPQTAPVFSPKLSRREMRNLQGRTANTASNPVVADADADADSEVEEVITAEIVSDDGHSESDSDSASDSSHAVVVIGDVVKDVVVIDDDEVDEDSDEDDFSEGPQTIAEATAAIALAEVLEARQAAAEAGGIVIDHREDAAEVTDDYEPFSISMSSTQATGIVPTTGSALILPTLPEHEPGARASFNHTGEILITGSIMLPSSISQFGADALSMDTSEIDLIADDEEISSSQDLAPVSASSAVSAYNTSNTVVTVPSKLRDRLPLILAITAAGLAVGVVALFITGYVLGVF